MVKKRLVSQSIVAILFVAMLFSCEGNLNEINKYNQEVNAPQSVANQINLFYTDSGKVKANLRSPKMQNYTSKNFEYKVFPIGVEVDFFDTDSTKNTIVADSAIVHESFDLIDMRNNVKIITADSVVLTTNQLYWDTKKEWVFTDRAYTIRLSNGTENNGIGFDSNQDFTIFNSRSNTGIQILKDSDL